MKKYLKHKATKISLGVLIFITLFFLMLPFGISYFLTDWLIKNGAETASIESFRLNPFLGRLTVRGLEVADVDDELLKHSNLVIDVGLGALFRHNIRIEQAEYSDLYINVSQSEDGSWRYGSVKVKNNEEPAEKPVQEPGKPWVIAADNVILNNCRVILHTPDLTIDLLIDRAELKEFATAARDTPGTLRLEGSLNGSPISLEFTTLRVAPHLELGGTIAVTGFPLKSVAGIVQEVLPVMEGGLSLDGSVQLQNSNEDGLQTEYDGSVTLARNRIATDNLTTEAGNISWKGLLSYSSPNTKKSGVKIQGQLLAGDFSLTLPDSGLEMQQEKIVLDTSAEVTIGNSVTVVHTGSLNLSGLGLKLPQITFSGNNISWEGSIDLDSSTPENLHTDGKLNGEMLELHTTGENVLSVNIDSVRLAQLQASPPGKVTIGSLQAGNLAIGLPGDLPLNLTLDDINLSQATSDDMQRYRATELQLTGFQADSAISGTPLGAFKKLAIQNISASTAPAFSADTLTVNALSMLGTEDETTVALQAAELQDVDWSPTGGLYGASLSLTSLNAAILRDSSGNININNQLSAMKKSETDSSQNPEKPAAESQATPIRFGEITLAGKSNVTFSDQTLAIPYSTNLQIDQVRITDLDSTRPEKQLSLLFEGDIENRAPLRITGDLSPFKMEPAVNLDLSLKNYPLTSLSPYTVQSVGTALAGGRMKVASSIKLLDNQLDLKNKVLLEKLKTDTISEELAAELNNQLPVPLDAALAMLRDRKGNIELAIPLSGPLDDLQVGISDIVVKALSKSIVSAASSYFIYTLGPYAALAYVGMQVGEGMLRIDLPPVQFTPSEKELTKDHRDYLERIATILKERPGTDLQLTPRVTSWEIIPEITEAPETETETEKPVEQVTEKNTINEEDLQQLLTELGQQRATAIQDYLVKTHSIDRSRLLISSTSIQVKQDATPAVTIEIK